MTLRRGTQAPEHRMTATEERRARVGVDIGGTFTDVVLQTAEGALHLAKVSTRADDMAQAVVDGVTGLLDRVGLSPAAVREVVHGTTVGSNAILQRRGARTGLITTRGFRDVLEIGRIRTPSMFDLTWKKPEPLVPRRWRVEADERMAADGTVVRPLDVEGLLATAGWLVAEGVESVALCFLNSYINPAHERQARDALAAAFPQLALTASYEVLPEIKEYERTSTTVVNAYLLTEMRAYLERLTRLLAGAGFTAPLLVMSSAGGIIGAEMASRKPVFAVGSGPAGGVIGAARLAATARYGDVIVFDMGGTTAKASVVQDGQPLLTSEYEFRDGISSPSRFVKGGGYVLKVPAIDIAEVGAGGGSIAWIDDGGLLRVGPDSAGADPGPAAYGQGNDRPTVTDANVHLGLLNPVALAGGTKPIHRDLATSALRRHVAEPLGLSVDAAARGVRELANVSMARAIRAVTVECGKDPRDFTLVAFGGSGPLHAADLARQLGIRRVVIPVMSGVFCSVGMLTSDVEHNFVRALVEPLDGCDPAAFAAVLDDLRADAMAALAAEGYAAGDVTLRFSADMRYLGQSSDLSVPLEPGPLTPALRDALRAGFHAAYHAAFGYADDDPAELVSLRVAASGRRSQRLDFADAGRRVVAAPIPATTREAAFGADDRFAPTPVLGRDAVGADPVAGPLIVEVYDTTVAVPPGATVHADACGSLVIDLPAA
jgi:N-methylhydantoinase A